MKSDIEHLQILAVDVGGTKKHAVLIDRNGTVISERRVPHTDRSPEEHSDEVCNLIEEVLSSDSDSDAQTSICVGVNGPTRVSDGLVLWAPALGWREFPLGERLRERFGTSIVVENDANLATLGEWQYGAGRGRDNLMCVFLGTGIGSGVVLNGTLCRGYRGGTGEIGRMPVGISDVSKDRRSDFGALESLASGRGITMRAWREARSYGERIDVPNAAHVFDAYRRGVSWATKVVETTMDYLAVALAQITCIIDPEAIILGGGVAHAYSTIQPLLRDRMGALVPRTPSLAKAETGSYASAFGAIYLAEQLFQSAL